MKYLNRQEKSWLWGSASFIYYVYNTFMHYCDIKISIFFAFFFQRRKPKQKIKNGRNERTDQDYAAGHREVQPRQHQDPGALRRPSGMLNILYIQKKYVENEQAKQ